MPGLPVMPEYLSLHKILEGFNSPVNEEQAWAVCFQCAKYLHSRWERETTDCYRFTGVQSVEIGKDGSVHNIITNEDRVHTQCELVQSLGLVIFQALDYGLSETEEHKLSPSLEHLIEKMTGSESDDEGEGHHQTQQEEGDEGIENDAEDDVPADDKFMLTDVMGMCTAHLADANLDPATHYKAVCRALVAEATELITFLDRMATEREKLTAEVDLDVTDDGKLEELKRADWARLWIQVMKELRQGNKLKKVEMINVHHSLEFELTPYEVLMEDIRSRRYTLNKVMDLSLEYQRAYSYHIVTIRDPANGSGQQLSSACFQCIVPKHTEINGDIPLQTKKDAHSIILEFIRSRPPLHPVKDRVLATPPVKSPDIREQLLEAIRSEPQLKPTPGRIVETSRTKLNEDDKTPSIAKKVIKPDACLLLSHSFDDEDEDDDLFFLDDKNKVTPSPMSPLTPLSPQSPKSPWTPKSPWQQSVALDISQGTVTFKQPDRRHSITVCESPTDVPSAPHLSASGPHDGRPPPTKAPMMANMNTKSWQSSLECLSLTIEEVMHIRSVLTKAELECTLVDPELHGMLVKGKVCFTCKKTRFSLFGQWGTKCKFCRRNVCSKCVTKMRIPTEHFEHIPVYTLSPSPLSPTSDFDFFNSEPTGSAPSSPHMPVRIPQTPPLPDHDNNNKLGVSRLRPSLQRAKTVTKPPPPRALQGPIMNICKDCKGMICNIIRASRTSLSTSKNGPRDKMCLQDFPASRKPSRNFHLDLRPVYK